jgi:hypothetical protein
MGYLLFLSDITMSSILAKSQLFGDENASTRENGFDQDGAHIEGSLKTDAKLPLRRARVCLMASRFGTLDRSRFIYMPAVPQAKCS